MTKFLMNRSQDDPKGQRRQSFENLTGITYKFFKKKYILSEKKEWRGQNTNKRAPKQFLRFQMKKELEPNSIV